MSLTITIKNERKRDKQGLKQIGKHIRYIRESAGMSLNDLAASCDLEKSNIRMLENCKILLMTLSLFSIALSNYVSYALYQLYKHLH